MSAKTDREVLYGGLIALPVLGVMIAWGVALRSLLVVIPAVLFVLSLVETIDCAVRLRRLRRLGQIPPKIRR